MKTHTVNCLIADEKTPLPEDRELHGFLPLAKVFVDLSFDANDVQTDAVNEKLIRAKRLISFGYWLSTYDVNSTKLVLYR